MDKINAKNKTKHCEIVQAKPNTPADHQPTPPPLAKARVGGATAFWWGCMSRGLHPSLLLSREAFLACLSYSSTGQRMRSDP